LSGRFILLLLWVVRGPSEEREAGQAGSGFWTGLLSSKRERILNPTALQPFLTTALPIMFTLLIAAWMNNKGVDGIHKRLDDIIVRLGRIETKLENHDERIVRLEERTSPLRTLGR
jgi:hypothetical protein